MKKRILIKAAFSYLGCLLFFFFKLQSYCFAKTIKSLLQLHSLLEKDVMSKNVVTFKIL